MRFPPTNNPIPTSPMDIYVIPVVFAFTFVVEGVGLWYLLKILNLNLKIKLIRSLTLALFLNLVTFFLGNYILLPFLSPYSGIRIVVDVSALFPIGLIVGISFFLGFLYGRRRKVASKSGSLVAVKF
jgi:hypothetical protein